MTTHSPAAIIETLSETQAREMVMQINGHAAEIGRLLIELRDREGWRALGYDTWTAFLRSRELDISRAHLYRLLHQAEVNAVLSPLEMGIPESHAREIPPHFTPEQIMDTARFARQTAFLEAKQDPEARHYAEAVELVRQTTEVDDGDPVRRQVYAAGYSPVIQLMNTGQLSPRKALALADCLTGCEPRVRGDVLRNQVYDPALIRELNRLYKDGKRGGETYGDLMASRVVQPGQESEAVPLAKATYKDLRAYLDLKFKVIRSGGNPAVQQVVTTLYPQDMGRSIRAFCSAMNISSQQLLDYLALGTWTGDKGSEP